MTPEEPADVAADETDEHVDVDSDPATQQGLVTQEHQGGCDQKQQGENVANITEHQHIRPNENENEKRNDRHCEVLVSSFAYFDQRQSVF